ncbi:hypothetical protein GWK47_023145 [Chionoecetes opilio]|uniref:Uncharacterized protein n=1 Tax=Chionoecetes opilio TaxID=41210 RepID=A0A8J4XN55_CHIOP|nr:hypothetical protein GWK47_023145 [Chionoecetes opilio]
MEPPITNLGLDDVGSPLLRSRFGKAHQPEDLLPSQCRNRFLFLCLTPPQHLTQTVDDRLLPDSLRRTPPSHPHVCAEREAREASWCCNITTAIHTTRNPGAVRPCNVRRRWHHTWLGLWTPMWSRIRSYSIGGALPGCHAKDCVGMAGRFQHPTEDGTDGKPSPVPKLPMRRESPSLVRDLIAATPYRNFGLWPATKPNPGTNSILGNHRDVPGHFRQPPCLQTHADPAQAC